MNLCSGASAMITAATASTYTWSTGANTASIVVSPTVTTTYTVTGSAASGCQGGAIFSQPIVSCVGIDQHESANDNLNVFPNPFSGISTIQLQIVSDANVQLFLFNALGQKLAILEYKELRSGTYSYNLNISKRGIYFISSSINGKITTKKIVNVD